MRRAGRVHGVRSLMTIALLSVGLLAGIAGRRQFIENQRATHAADLVQRLLDADTPQVPDIVGAMQDDQSEVRSFTAQRIEQKVG